MNNGLSWLLRLAGRCAMTREITHSCHHTFIKPDKEIAAKNGCYFAECTKPC